MPRAHSAEDAWQLVSLDPERAIAAVPKLAPAGSPEADKALEALHLTMEARGAPPEEGQRRLAQVEQLLGPEGEQDQSHGRPQWMTPRNKAQSRAV